MSIQTSEQVEIERLRAVAKRYEFLSGQFSPFGLNIDGRHPWVWRGNPDRLRGPNLDAAIDAAISEHAMQELVDQAQELDMGYGERK